MAPIHDAVAGIDWEQAFQRLGELYNSDFVDEPVPQVSAFDALDEPAPKPPPNIVPGPNGHGPSIVIPQILVYLRDNDEKRDDTWKVNFPLITAYLEEAHRHMMSGGLGFSSVKLRAALEDALIIAKTHQNWSKNIGSNTPWTTKILRSQTTQERLLTYPKGFPLPEPNRAKSQYRPVRPMPRLHDNNLPLWNTSLRILETAIPNGNLSMLTEVDYYVEAENEFFRSARQLVNGNQAIISPMNETRFGFENSVYEYYASSGLAETASNAPPPYNRWPTQAPSPDNPDGAKGPSLYLRRGWQRAALQLCLNQLTNHENRVINTPWRRPVLPYEAPVPLPKDVPYAPRIPDPKKLADGKIRDPFAWLHWSSQYTRIVDYLADSQRRRYNNQVWGNMSASALPLNFRGPRIYRGLGAHDQYWIRIGGYLDNLEGMLRKAWEAAPRPLLRAILRDIDAARHDNTGGPNIGNNNDSIPVEDDDDLLSRKRYWRRDIRRRTGIDNREDSYDDGNFKLVDELDIAWLRYLCEPSRTLEMCDPSQSPPDNLAAILDAKLQSYFRNLELSNTPDSQGLRIWEETADDIEAVIRNHPPTLFTTVVAYINGCKESEIMESGSKRPNPANPNKSYQFSLEEAEFTCVELHNLGRCVFTPSTDTEPSKVDRPMYMVHPEDRVTWRYDDIHQFRQMNADYLNDMMDHYHGIYGKWAFYKNKLKFYRELEFMLDHTGSDFPAELQRLEIQEQNAPMEDVNNKRRAFIRKNLVPEGLCRIGGLKADSIEADRESPYQEDLASWDEVGTYLSNYREKKGRKVADRYYFGHVYPAQTPERTVQFFRNLAYRMGRTMRYVGQIKERLQYLENGPETRTVKQHLDLSDDLKQPRPESNSSADAVQTPVIVEKWWHAVSRKDYDLAIEQWANIIQDGSGEMALLPPRVEDVLAKAGPRSPFRNPLKGKQDPFTVIREGIINDCFQNRPTIYPVRLVGFKDHEDKEFQGFERPNLFEWATKDQRRYQAQHTRRHFFNMQRWPLDRMLPHRREAIRARKDEVLRSDPSQRKQAYGILTHRLPVGDEKPRYIRTLVDHAHSTFDWDDQLNPYQTLSEQLNGPLVDNPFVDEALVDLLAADNGNIEANTSIDPNINDQVNATVNECGAISDNAEVIVNTQVNNQTNDQVQASTNLIDNAPVSDNAKFIVNTQVNNQTNDQAKAKANVKGPQTKANRTGSDKGVQKLSNTSVPGNNSRYNADSGSNVERGRNASMNADMNTNMNANDSNVNADNNNSMGTNTGSRAGKVRRTAQSRKMDTTRMDRTTTSVEKKSELVPLSRRDEEFASGPALYPMGDTLLQKVLISNELSNALYPAVPFYKDRFLGLPRIWQRLAGADEPLIPLVPPVARSNIPRSNPRKRKMPIEFLNVPTTHKKFSSDMFALAQPGGFGGQFGAAVGKGTENESQVHMGRHAAGRVTQRTGSTASMANNMNQDAGGSPMQQGGGNMASTMNQSTTMQNTTMQSTTMQSPMKQSPMKQSTMKQSTTMQSPMEQSTQKSISQTAGGDNASNMNQNVGGSTMQKTGVNTANTVTSMMNQNAATNPEMPYGTDSPLRVYPNPSRTLARKLFIDTFPKGWRHSEIELQYLYSSALMALQFSIKNQLARPDMQPSYKILKELAESPECAALKEFTKPADKDDFDIHCVSLLLQTYGEKFGLKLQLGFIQEDPLFANHKYALPMGARGDMHVAYLVGSKYNSDADRTVVWVRILEVGEFPGYVENCYNGNRYNCFQGIRHL